MQVADYHLVTGNEESLNIVVKHAGIKEYECTMRNVYYVELPSFRIKQADKNIVISYVIFYTSEN